MERIVVTGSMALDQILRFQGSFADHIRPEALHVLSVSFLADEMVKSYGGTAGNIAYNFGLLKRPCAVLSSIGKDGNEYVRHLEDLGIDTSLVKVVDGAHTANFFVVTDNKDCQIAGFYPGAMEADASLELPDECDFLVVSPTVPAAMDKFVMDATARKLRYAYVPAQQLPRLTWEQVRRGIHGAEIVIGNDYEIGLICELLGMTPEGLAKELKVLVTTLGSKGSKIESKGEVVEVPPIPIERPVDPTGAGDGYVAGFLNCYLAGKELYECGVEGTKLATLAVGQRGTQNHTL